MMREIDIIGDVHGNLDRLIALLRKLGYHRGRDGDRAFAHNRGRTAAFAGDLVDGGPDSLSCVELVAAMVRAGSGIAVMGDHDFNIVALNRDDPAKPGQHLRQRTERNLAQAAATQAQVDAEPARGARALAFLAGLPLWIETPSMRIAHAHWDTGAMRVLRPHLDDRNALTEAGFALAAATEGETGDARSILLSGPERDCAPYLDRSGHRRTKERVAWWEEGGDDDVRPLFFGHYAMRRPLAIHNGAHACVDAGIAAGGPIAAYSHQIGRPLSADRFTYA